MEDGGLRRGAVLTVMIRATPTRPAIPFASWTAPAKRSDDGAFARTREPRAFADRRPHESGVAPFIPPIPFVAVFLAPLPGCVSILHTNTGGLRRLRPPATVWQPSGLHWIANPKGWKPVALF